jgi:hypothetical protein
VNREDLFSSIDDSRFTIHGFFLSLATCHLSLLYGYTPAQSFTEGRREGQSGTRLIDSDLFEPYERLITIEILGRRVEVPENNRLLRCFQFLSMRSISYGDFCWNGDCTNCQFWYQDEEESAGRGDDKTALSCRFKVREGMNITRLNEHVKLEGINNGKDEGGTRNDE